MVSLDQIKKLEDRVNKAVHLIGILKEENAVLRTTLETTQVRIGELEELIAVFKADQAQIESGILSAIERLDTLEDDLDTTEVHEQTDEKAQEAPPEEPPQIEKTPQADNEDEGQSPAPQEGELGIF